MTANVNRSAFYKLPYVAICFSIGISTPVFSQGRLDLEIEVETSNNIAIGTGSTPTTATSGLTNINSKSDPHLTSYAGSVIVDLNICDDKAVLINRTSNNTAVGGTIAGSVILSESGVVDSKSISRRPGVTK